VAARDVDGHHPHQTPKPARATEGGRMSQFGDAIDFILHSSEARSGGTNVGGSQLWPLIGKHLELTGASVGIAVAIAVPLALWLGHIGKGEFLATSIANVGRAVPSLALIAFFVAYLGVGFTNVTLALVLLAIPPILTNTYVGVRQVDRDSVDAARGMGMTGLQIVRAVELPLALPLVFGGIRTSVVNVIATATIAPLAGVVTLGDPIIAGGVYGDDGRLGASILVALIAIAAEALFAFLQHLSVPQGIRMTQQPLRRQKNAMRRITLAMLAALALVVVVAGCGSDSSSSTSSSSTSASTSTPAASTPASTSADTTAGSGGTITHNPGNGSTTVVVGSKNFTEQKVLGEIYSQALQAAGYQTKTALNLGDEKTALKALNDGSIDGYPEYTGTALLSFFNVPTDKLPSDPAKAYDEVKADFAKENPPIEALTPTPFTSSNEVGLTQAQDKKLGGITKISQLKGKSQDLTLYGTPECRQRLDCLLGLQKVYGLKFKKFVPVDPSLRHEVLQKGQADLSIVFTTDPQNTRDNVVLLKDDKGMFPPYNSTFLVKKSFADKAGPDLAKTIALVNQGLTADAIQELNARVDLDKQTPAVVATQYLQESRYVK
jgi:glycine betaine/choline ABC-type transport system substrate-binding protein/ABC-type proline/glycine betaine transport system permease subunit